MVKAQINQSFYRDYWLFRATDGHVTAARARCPTSDPPIGGMQVWQYDYNAASGRETCASARPSKSRHAPIDTRGFSNDYGRPRVERWSAEEDARLIAYYLAHSLNGRLVYEAMMELKLKFRNRSKAALYGRICELRKSGRLDPPAGCSHGSSVSRIFHRHKPAKLACALSGVAP